MKNNELPPDIASLENLLKSKIEIFDKALNKNMCLDEVRKLFHELRILKMKVDELYNQNSIECQKEIVIQSTISRRIPGLKS